MYSIHQKIKWDECIRKKYQEGQLHQLLIGEKKNTNEKENLSNKKGVLLRM